MPPGMWRQHRARTVAAGVFLAIGLVWIGQGVGVLRGSSFMVGDLRWALAGLVAAVVGVVLLLSARLSTR
jgi:hypothetical protein